MKKNNAVKICAVTLILAVLHLIAAVICIAELPAKVPLHFTSKWVCDQVGSPWLYLIFAAVPLLSAVAALLWVKFGKMKQPKINAITLSVIPGFLIAMFWLIYPVMRSGAAVGDKIEKGYFYTLLPLLIGTMLVMLGNYMPVIEPNHVLGIRVSWTLKNPQCWRRTHRFGGKIMVTGGLLIIVTALIALFLNQAGKTWVLIAMISILFFCLFTQLIYAYRNRNAE